MSSSSSRVAGSAPCDAGFDRDPVERVVQALRRHGLEPRRGSDGQWSCRCPSHDDAKPSLSVGTGDGRRALLRRHAGCENTQIAADLGLRMADLMPERSVFGNSGSVWTKPFAQSSPPEAAPKAKSKTQQPTAVSKSAKTFPSMAAVVCMYERLCGKTSSIWTYSDSAGTPVMAIFRWDAVASTGDSKGRSKEIRQCSRRGDVWVCEALPAPRPPYGLTRLLSVPSSEPVYVCEGEKPTDAARELGLVAITSSGGAGAAAKTDWSSLAGRNVVILPDHDMAGEKYACDVARLAQKAGAASVRVVRLAESLESMPQGGDIVEFVEASSSSGQPEHAIRSRIVDLAMRAQPLKRTSCKPSDRVDMIPLSEVKPEPVRWLWPGHLAIGKLTLVSGDPGLGKSLMTVDIAARVTAGVPWPFGPHSTRSPAGVVFLCGEDDVTDTIVPGFNAAGGDTKRAALLRGVKSDGGGNDTSHRCIDLGRDLDALEEAIDAVPNCQLVVIDPISAYMGRVDSHKNADVRAILQPLAALAVRRQVAVLVVTHLNKNLAGPAVHRAVGSIAFTAAVRVALVVCKDPGNDQRRLVFATKSNLGPSGRGLAFQVTCRTGDAPRVDWSNQPPELSVEEALGSQPAAGAQASELDEAIAWLKECLSNGAKPTREVLIASLDAGHSKATIRRAKSKLGVLSVKTTHVWVWAFPGATQAKALRDCAQGAQHPEREHLEGTTPFSHIENRKALMIGQMSTLNERLGVVEQSLDPAEDEQWGELA